MVGELCLQISGVCGGVRRAAERKAVGKKIGVGWFAGREAAVEGGVSKAQGAALAPAASAVGLLNRCTSKSCLDPPYNNSNRHFDSSVRILPPKKGDMADAWDDDWETLADVYLPHALATAFTYMK